MHKPKILFFDIDGTLIDMQKKCITPLMLSTLHKLQANGIRLAIATGRSPMTVPLEEFPGVQFDVFITFNGSYCYDKDRVLFASPIPTEDIRTLRRNAAALGRPMCLATESRLAANGTDADLADYCAIAKIPVPIAEDFDALAAGKVYQIMIGGPAPWTLFPPQAARAPASPMYWRLTASTKPTPWPLATATTIWKCLAPWVPAWPWPTARTH